MLSTTDLIIYRREHKLRVARAERYGWLYPIPSRACRRNQPMTTLKLAVRSALTSLAAVAFGRGLN